MLLLLVLKRPGVGLTLFLLTGLIALTGCDEVEWEVQESYSSWEYQEPQAPDETDVEIENQSGVTVDVEYIIEVDGRLQLVVKTLVDGDSTTITLNLDIWMHAYEGDTCIDQAKGEELEDNEPEHEQSHGEKTRRGKKWVVDGVH